jgi:hypothetical protein
MHVLQPPPPPQVSSRTGRVIKVPAWMAGNSEFAHGEGMNAVAQGAADRLPAHRQPQPQRARPRGIAAGAGAAMGPGDRTGRGAR